MKSKNITMTVHIQSREPGPLTADERKQLADFLRALMDIGPDDNGRKVKIHDQNK
jgi:hypothetical protein